LIIISIYQLRLDVTVVTSSQHVQTTMLQSFDLKLIVEIVYNRFY
jgi:hypothetical protein